LALLGRLQPRAQPSASCPASEKPAQKEKSALPEEVGHWSLTTLREKLIKIRAKVVSHGRYATFQKAEVAVSRDLFRKILSLIDDLRQNLPSAVQIGSIIMNMEAI
jgi:hypothetical protein